MTPAEPPSPAPPSERAPSPGPAPSDARGRNLAILLWGGAALLAAVRIAAWALPAPGAPAPPRPAATTVLRVVDDTGRPVVGARVTLPGEDVRATDARGRARLPRGARRVTVRADGFARWTGTVPDAARVRLALEVAAVVRGEVRTAQGAPVPDATVRLVWRGTEPVPPHATRTGPDGRFRFDALSVGDWTLEAEAPGHEPAARPLRASTRFRNPPVVVDLRPVGRVLARVLDRDGAPRPGARVVLGGSGVWPPRSVEAGPDGTAVFEDVPPGLYALRARSGDDVARVRATLLLDPGETREAELRLEPGRTLALEVRDASSGDPIEGAAVTAGDGGLASTPVAGRTGADGRVRLAGLPGGRVRVAVRAAGRVPWIAAISDDAPVVVRLYATGRVAGRVVGPGGAPVPGATVEITGTGPGGAPVLVAARPEAGGADADAAPGMGELGVMPGLVPPLPIDGAAAATGGTAVGGLPPAGPGAAPILSDAEGRFEVTDVAPGALRVLARADGLAPGHSGPFTLAPGGDARDVEVRLEQVGRVRGRVVDARGFPVAGVEVRARSDRDPRPTSTVSADDGGFDLGGVVGAVFLTATAPGLPPARQRVDVAPGAEVEVELRLEASAVRLAARVLDTRGFPVPGASVRVDALRASAPARRHGVAGPDGTLEVRGLPAPPWRLTVEHPEHATLRVPRVDEIDDEVQLVLRPATRVAGRVFDEWSREPVVGATVELRGGGRIRATRTDGEGRWRFGRVAAGDRELVVRSPRHLPATRALTVGDRDLDAGVVWLAPGGSVTGEVVDRWGTPVPGAEVAMGTPPDWANAARTDPAGRFTLEGVRPGGTHVSARHPDAGRARTRQPVTVRKVEETPGVYLRLPAALPAPGAAAAAPAPPRIALDLSVESGPTGVRVTRVGRGSSAWRAGVREGDAIRAVDGVPVASAGQTRALLRGPEGEPVFLELRRGDRERTLTVPREPVP